jgi:type VI secretion system protein ImpC
MAKKKDDFSFGFSSKKPKESPRKKEADDAGSTDAPAGDAPADPFASTDSSASDPFASTGDASSSDPFASTSDSSSSDPFASTDTSSADPFASTDSSASSDPFASTSGDASNDPFASTDTPADSSSDPFASTSTDSSSDPFASTSTDASSDPFASPSADASSDPFASASSDSSGGDATATAEAPAAEEPAKEEKPKGPQVVVHKQFRMLVMGDFSGRANRELMETGESVAGRKALAIDSDSFERVMGKVKPEIRIPVGEGAITLKFRKIEDFRPEAILEQVEGFQGLLALRDKLKNQKTFKEAAETVRKMAGAEIAAPAAKKGEEGMSDFERLINQPAKKDAAAANADAFIQSVVAGYGVDAPDPDQAKMVKFVDEALSAGLRAILRHPAFQAVESSWRGVEFLTSRLNTDEDLKLFIFDISRDELYADLNGAPAIEKTGFFQTMVEIPRSAGNEPWSLVVGNFFFEQQPKDIGLLAKLASLMHSANIPFLGGATSRVAGFPSFAKFPDSGRWQPPADLPMWEKIRGHKQAQHLGLAAPRFLLRIPYGQKTDAVETFPFEEMPADKAPEHAGYLWGNGAFAVAYCMGQAFLEDGWGFDIGPGGDVTDLPVHMAVIDGDKEMTPCAEGWLSDRIGDVLRNLGLIPLLSVRNAGSVKVAGVQSLSKGKPLAAAWVGQT